MPLLPFRPAIKRRIAIACWIIAATIATVPLAAAFFVTPEDIESGRIVLTPACPYKRLTGRDCPSCGLTRAFAAIGHGRFGDAMHYHRGSLAVFTLAAAFAAISWAKSVRTWRTGFSPPERPPEGAGTSTE